MRPAPARPIDRPVTVKYLFYLPDRRRRDLTNLQEAADDILVAYGILADDCYRIVASHDGSRCLVDRDSPRTEIWITEVERDDTDQLVKEEVEAGDRVVVNADW